MSHSIFSKLSENQVRFVHLLSRQRKHPLPCDEMRAIIRFIPDDVASVFVRSGLTFKWDFISEIRIPVSLSHAIFYVTKRRSEIGKHQFLRGEFEDEPLLDWINRMVDFEKLK